MPRVRTRQLAAQELILPMHVGHLRDDGTLANVPSRANPLVIEIGASDRNTADVELLPKLRPSAFLVTCEPLIDKYARGLSRSKDWAGDIAQPLGKHHQRGMLLPIAVGPMRSLGASRSGRASDDADSSRARPILGEQQILSVGTNAGCSSLAQRNRSNSRSEGVAFGWQCGAAAEQRLAWVVPLEQVLLWVGTPKVQMVKVGTRPRPRFARCALPHYADGVRLPGNRGLRRLTRRASTCPS